MNSGIIRKKVAKDFDRLDPVLRSLVLRNLENEEICVPLSYYDHHGRHADAIRFDTEDTSYLIRIPARIRFTFAMDGESRQDDRIVYTDDIQQFDYTNDEEDQ